MHATIFLKSSIQQFKDYKALGDRTFAQLSEADFYYRPNEQSNSIAVIIRHMHGNMLSRWTHFLTEDGEKSWRQRDSEFEEQSRSQQEWLGLWEQGWAVLLGALESLGEADLDKTVYIRTKPMSVIEAIQRQLTHYASHVGQMMYIGKLIKAEAWQPLSISNGDSAAFNEQMSRK